LNTARVDWNDLSGVRALAKRSALIALLALIASLGPPSEAAKAPRGAAAFSPDGRLLAVGGYGEVTVMEAATGKVAVRLAGPAGSVTAVAFSPDGKALAASGGVPGRSGEIRLWNTQGWQPRSFTGAHADVVYSIAWSPDGKTLAAGSYDKLVSLWDPSTGQARKLKDHTDAVYSVAFSPDGRRVASASGDRTVKLWDVATAKRLFTLSDSTAELYSVAFAPSGKQVAAAGVDKMLRTWSIGPSSGALARSAFAHEGPIIRVLYAPHGEGLYTASEDRAVKLWDPVTLSEKKVYEKQPDWPLGLAIAPGDDLLAVSRYDGSVTVYQAASGAVRAFLPATEVAATKAQSPPSRTKR
jgi:WD40 repeat protein